MIQEPPRVNATIIRRLIAKLIEDAVKESARRLAQASPRSADEVRNAGSPLLSFSSAVAKADRDIKQFLLSRMYRHPRIIRIMTGAETVVRDLFAHYLHHSNDMPVEWVRPFEAELHKYVDTTNPRLLQTIMEKKILDDALKAEMAKVIKDCKEQFVAARKK